MSEIHLLLAQHTKGAVGMECTPCQGLLSLWRALHGEILGGHGLSRPRCWEVSPAFPPFLVEELVEVMLTKVLTLFLLGAPR